MGIPEEDLPEIITRWRSSNKRIVDLWYKIENAAIATVKTGCSIKVSNLLFEREADFMTITLPSGRKLFYANPELGMNQWDKPSVTYCSQSNKRGSKHMAENPLKT
ncbi:MAG: hypothetical protein II857_12755 [Selenomonadaceae bacterium]|nr:hypothetical protein [Selenomonadaceae bacterium]